MSLLDGFYTICDDHVVMNYQLLNWEPCGREMSFKMSSLLYKPVPWFAIFELYLILMLMVCTRTSDITSLCYSLVEGTNIIWWALVFMNEYGFDVESHLNLWAHFLSTMCKPCANPGSQSLCVENLLFWVWATYFKGPSCSNPIKLVLSLKLDQI